MGSNIGYHVWVFNYLYTFESVIPLPWFPCLRDSLKIAISCSKHYLISSIGLNGLNNFTYCQRFRVFSVSD